MNSKRLLRHIRILLVIFIAALLASGITAFPIQTELHIATQIVEHFGWENSMAEWIRLTHQGVMETNAKYPFIAYGTDWLAFAHIVLAILFIGPLRDPVKNIWVIEFGMIACVAILPLAFIAGPIRYIPLYWQLIDCSFGVFGGLLLWICYGKIRLLIQQVN